MIGGLMAHRITRRSTLAIMAGSAFLRAQSKPFTFGFSLYGMRDIPWRDGINHVARIGYKATELCLRPGWNTEAKLLNKTSRAEIRKCIADAGLVLPSVMENLALARPGGNVQANLDRLKSAAEICYECSPGQPALIETTVGGRPNSWDENKNKMAEELAVWAKTVEELKVTLAIKSHSKTSMNYPEKALWLSDQVKSPRLKLVYDYSHYWANHLDMVKTMQQIVPRSVFVHIKDVQFTADSWKFVLPGDGNIDYKEYTKDLAAAGYRGPVLIEVSVDVYDLPGYDGVKAAEHCWQKLSPAFA
jgi:sugar phosphate isomerase/epimerase